MKLNWKFGLVAGFFLIVFTLYPQLKLFYLRGSEWQGHYAYNDIDEVAYASYIKALIDGRPRKNDPYTGRDDSPASPQPESLFSIQFAAPYTLAIPARIFGLNAPWTMIIGGAVAGFLAALACFWVIGKITGNSLFAMMGSLAVLAGGALAAGEGAIGEILDIGFPYPYFPAFRRYIPAVPFAAFFALLGLIWLLLQTDDVRRRLVYGSLAVFCFAYTVFSYFYTWTTAAAWLGILFLILILVRPADFARDFRSLTAVGAGCLITLIPYAYLLSQRATTMDEVQLLVHTRAPDLTRFPIYISVVVLAILGVSLAFKTISLKEKETIFALSLALVSPVVFNQQIITGRSLQPIHYQVFIGNYVSALALIMSIGILLKKKNLFGKNVSKTLISVTALLAIVWGFVECHYTVRVLDDMNVARDAQMPLGRRLTELAKEEVNPYKSVIFHYDIAEADDLPTIAPQATLWARHQHIFVGVTWQENKERFYQYLHFKQITPEDLADRIKRRGDFVSMIALFGWGRHTDRLNAAYKPLTYGEVDEEVRKYADYIKNFNPRNSPETILSYVVVPNNEDIDLTNLDKWYERDKGEIVGNYWLYRVKLRQ